MWTSLKFCCLEMGQMIEIVFDRVKTIVEKDEKQWFW